MPKHGPSWERYPICPVICQSHKPATWHPQSGWANTLPSINQSIMKRTSSIIHFPCSKTFLLSHFHFSEDCTDPGTPVNGNQVGSPTYLAYTTVTFACNEGFSLVGAEITTCVNGSYTLNVPQCIGKGNTHIMWMTINDHILISNTPYIVKTGGLIPYGGTAPLTRN